MVKSLFNSLSLPKECCNLQSANELVLLIFSLAIPASRATSTSRQFKMKSKKDSTLSTSTPRNNIIYCYIMSLKKIICKIIINMGSSSFGSNFEFMVKYLFNSLSIHKECCNLKRMTQLLLLIISLTNPGFKSHVKLKTIQKWKARNTVLYPPQPLRHNLIYCHIMSLKEIIYKIIINMAKVSLVVIS